MGHKRGAWSSPRWIKYSRAMRRLHPWCSVKAPGCLRTKRLEVHHMKYPPKPLPLWIVGPWNLVVACHACHAKISGIHHAGELKFNPDRYAIATERVMGAARFNLYRVVARIFWGIVLGVPAMLVLATAFAAVLVNH
jgi:hypothetical protein